MKSFFLLLLLLSQLAFANITDTTNTTNTNSDYAKQVQFPVTKFKLDNGLEILVHEDFTTPLVSFNQWYRVGSRNEKPGMTGIAHFFEHLMFKGTPQFSSDDFENLIQSNGGTNNAFTTYDYTGYYVDLPASKIDLIFKIESDRMVNLIFNPVSIQSEREVVKEERRFRTENSVFGYMNEATFASVFKVHPYRWPVIGSMKDLNAVTLDQFKDFYRTYYAPNNSIVVIVGAVSAKKVKELADKYYAPIPSQKLPELNIPPEPEQKGQRVVTLRKDVQNPYFAISYKTVGAGHKDQYALDLLSNILSEGTSSRLYKRLVYNEQLVSSINSYDYTPKDAGIFTVNATVKSDVDLNKAIKSVYSELYNLRNKTVTADELQKAKNQVIKSYVDSLKTISGKARALATNQILFGNYEVMFEDINKYLAVTEEDIQRVANTYLQPQRRSLIKVLPSVHTRKTAKNSQ
ncbi:MAG: insulinase family protein [Bdellovibrionaceae bacterium]|nr:insulinase family protein [Pseudobdellovibrionaceae bacterium]